MDMKKLEQIGEAVIVVASEGINKVILEDGTKVYRCSNIVRVDIPIKKA